MTRTLHRALVAEAASLALVLLGCGSQPTSPATGSSGAPSGAAGAPGSDLVPTGLVMAGLGTPPKQLVADGTGAAWVRGPWNLTRIDADSGRSQTWDAAEDGVFAAADLRLAPATGAGVWLILGTRVRFFDGLRFPVDLDVPAAFLADLDSAPTSGGQGPVTAPGVLDVAQVDDRVWMSIGKVPVSPHDGNAQPLRVVVHSAGQWSSQEVPLGALSADASAGAWALGESSGAGFPSVWRWDGNRWLEAPLGIQNSWPVQVAAGPAGQSWVLCHQCAGAGNEQPGLLRFDGQQWLQAFGPSSVKWLRVQSVDGSGTPRRRLAVAPDGAAWVAGPSGVGRFEVDGSVRRYGVGQGIEPVLGRDIVTVAGEVLVLDDRGLYRLEGKRFQRVWRDRAQAVPGNDSYPARSVLPVSGDRAWSVADLSGRRPGTWLSRYRDGKWIKVRAATGAILARDGAVWARTDKGLLRIKGRKRNLVTVATGQLDAAGPRGSVWSVFGSPGASNSRPDDQLVRYRADGGRVLVGRPKGWDTVCVIAAGSEGSVWVSRGHIDSDGDYPYVCPGDGGEEAYKGIGEELALWDGRKWTKVTAPTGFIGLAISGGTTWAAVVDAPQGYPSGWWAGQVGWVDWYRVSGTEWTKVTRQDGLPWAEPATGLGPVLPAPNGGACVQVYGLACIRADATTYRHDVIPGMRTGAESLRIAPDGSIWAVGPQVARLPDLLTGSQ